MSTVEVIDLTTSPANSIIVIDDDSHDNTNHSLLDDPLLENSSPKKRRKKRSKGKLKDEGPVNEQGSVNGLPDDKHQTDEDLKSRVQKRKQRDEDKGLSSKLLPIDPLASNDTLFTIDTAGHPLKSSPETNNLPRQKTEKVFHIQDGLILPPHVSVALDSSMSMNGPEDAQESDDRQLSPTSDVSGIDFLDDDLVFGAPRYFHDTTTTKFHKTCKRCGDEGHDVKNCPNTIDCPRIGPTDGRRTSAHDCNRCGSLNHHTTNCPMLWRIYTYLTDKERDVVLTEREGKRDLSFDEGGEGYIAGDHWCYNCGQCGHLGDDCKEVKFNFDKPEDYSAFGLYNCLSGPFASQSQPSQYKRAPRSWELNDRTRGGIPVDAQEDVGRKSREKAKKKAREAQSRLEEKDDDDDIPDWFNQNHGKTKEKPRSNSRREPGSSNSKHRQPLVFRITSEEKDPRFKSSREDSRPSLLNRIDMDEGENGSRFQGKDRSRDRNREKDSREKGRGRKQGQGQGQGWKRQRIDDYAQRPGDRYPSNERRWRGGYDR
ncbi:hypothetical protein Clacol_001407 [Clathrus columnatus]|uniref:CCHC-type domain-containing protein n=1 Tax=Clathrus columnatus TaxID=1419009 RepID=A0AAV5A0U9_9AGAM|nr:hypothetical protein Clacol_001407 [Clathrus columnatus]